MESAYREDYPDVTDEQWEAIISQPHSNLYNVVRGYEVAKQEIKRSAKHISELEESINLLPHSWRSYICDNGTGHELWAEYIDDEAYGWDHDIAPEEQLFAIYFDG